MLIIKWWAVDNLFKLFIENHIIYCNVSCHFYETSLIERCAFGII